MKTIYTVILYLCLSGLLCCLSNGAKAQSRSEIERHRTVLPVKPKRVYKEARENQNEIQMLFSGLFLTYKTVISSQDNNVCSFTPSCSEFGIQAVKRHGLIMGGVRTMDRLTRCNGLSPENYPVDLKSKLLVDNP